MGIGSAAQRHVNNMNLHSNMFEMCLYQRQNMFTNAINECDVVFAFCEHICLCLDCTCTGICQILMYLQTQLPIDAVTMLVLQCLKATIPAKLSINFMITPPYTTLNCPQSEGCTEWIREDCELVTLYRGTSFPSGWNDGTIPLQLQATYRQKKNSKLR